MDASAGDPVSPGSTRNNLITAASRLFAAQGYAATSVAQIAEAAGLSAGAGGLYRHFRSKEDLLTAVVEEFVARLPVSAPAEVTDPVTLEERLAALCRLVLSQLESQRELTRITMRDLEHFPELLTRRREVQQGIYTALAQWISEQPEARGADRDWPALAAVLAGSIVYGWLFTDVFGEPPAGADRERFVEAWVDTASRAITAP